MRRALLVVLAAMLLPLAACNQDDLPGAARIDVDTPALRALKHDAGVDDCRPGSAGAVDEGLPEITLPCLGGGPDVDLSALRGPMVINLWASNCTPCRSELPVLQQFHEKYADQVALVGVDWQDTQPAAALQLVADSGVTYPLLADPQNSLSGAGSFPIIRGIPQTVLIDADGNLAYVESGEIHSVGQLVDLVQAHLGVTL